VDADYFGSLGLEHSGALVDLVAGGRMTAIATCGDTPGPGQITVALRGTATDDSPAGLFLQGLGSLSGLLLEDDFIVAVRAGASCTEAKAEDGGETAGDEGAGASTAAGPPDSSHFVEVTEGSAAGGNIFNNTDESHVGSNPESVPFFFVRPAVLSPQALVVVQDPPLFDDGTPAVGIEVYQGDQRQGCGTKPETTTFIEGIVSGLAFNGDSVGCLQLYDPTKPATIYLYVVIGDTIADHSLVIEPDTFPGLGSVEFSDGIGSLHPPESAPFPVPNDLDGDGDRDFFDWVSGNNLGITQGQPLAGDPPFLITNVWGETDGNAVVINIDLDNPLDPGPEVSSAGLAFRLDVADDISIVGGPQFIDGTLFVGVTCLPVPENCSPVDVEATPNVDYTSWATRFAPPPEVDFDPVTAQMSATAFFMATTDSPSLFQQFPETGSVPFQR